MPNYTYITNIPASSNNPSADQPNMQINTNSIDSLITEDHYGFNAAGLNFSGYHKKVSLVDNPGPFPTPAGVGSVLYSGATNNLVFTNASLAGAGVQLTVGAKPPIAAANGSTFLPGGLLLQWGTGVTLAAPPASIGTLTQSFTYAFSTVYSASAIVLVAGSQKTASLSALTNTNITIRVTTSGGTQAPNETVYWMAIGLA